MPLFYFILNVGQHSFPDTEGEEFANDVLAHHHAIAVAKELMKQREAKTRFWRIQVCDDYLQPRFEIPFACVERTFSGLPQEMRLSIERVVHRANALNEAVLQMQRTLGDVRETLIRADKILASLPQRARS